MRDFPSFKLLVLCALTATSHAIGISKCIRASNGVDFITDRIELYRELPFGTCRYKYVRIVSNGYVVFGSASYLKRVPELTADLPLIAVYGDDMDGGLICYDHWLNEPWAKEEASKLLKQWLPSESAGFAPDFVFSVTYHNVVPHSDSNKAENSSQSVSVMLLVAANQEQSRVFSVPVTYSGQPSVKSLSQRQQAVVVYPVHNGRSVVVTAAPFYELARNSSHKDASKRNNRDSGDAEIACNKADDSESAGSDTLFPYVSMPTSARASKEARSVDVPVTIPFGACYYHYAQISTNGFIRLLPTREELASQRVASSGRWMFDSEYPIISPFGTDCSSTITYRKAVSVSELGSTYFLGRNSDDSESLRVLLVVTFRGIEPIGRPNVSITAQVVLLSDGNDTYLAFNYDRDVANTDNWPGYTWPRPVVTIGFSYGSWNEPSYRPTLIALLPNSDSQWPAALDYDYVRGNILGNHGHKGRWIYRVHTAGVCKLPSSRNQTTQLTNDNGLLPHANSDLMNVKSNARIHCLPASSPGPGTSAVVEKVHLKVFVPFGACSYATAHISSYGAISLGVDSVLDESSAGYHLLMAGGSRHPFIAPFSARLAASKNNNNDSSVCYSQHTADSSAFLLKRLTELLPVASSSSSSSALAFKPTFALIVTWNNVTLPYSNSSLSFQAALLTDGLDAGLFLLHAHDNPPFGASIFGSAVGVGFTYGASHNPTLTRTNRNQLLLFSPRWPQSVAEQNLADIPSNTPWNSTWYFRVDTTTGYCQAPVDPASGNVAFAFPNLLPFPQAPATTNASRNTCMPAGDETVSSVPLIRAMPLAGCNFTTAYISANGWITFGLAESDTRVSLRNSTVPVFSALNADLYAPDNRTICYSQHTEGDAMLADIRLRMRSLRSTRRLFRPTFAFVVTYYRIQNYNAREQFFTFQSAFFTDGKLTQFFFNYDQLNPVWLTAKYPLSVGFTYGTVADPNDTHVMAYINNTSPANFSGLDNSGFNGVGHFEAPAFPASRCLFFTESQSTTSPQKSLSNLLPSPQTTPHRNFSNASCLNSKHDDYVEEVRLNFPLPFSGCQHEIAYISTNGFITLTFPDDSITPNISIMQYPAFLPYNTDLYVEHGLELCWTQHTAEDDYLNEIKSRLSATNSSMAVKYALVVTYHRIKVLFEETLVTFQFAIFTDGKDTQFFFNYDGSEWSWEFTSRMLQIGYTYGANVSRSDHFRLFHRQIINQSISPLEYPLHSNLGQTGVYFYTAERFSLGRCESLAPINEDPDPERLPETIDENLLPISSQHKCFPPADDASYEVTLNYSLPVGGCSYTSAFVSTNGFITLNESLNLTDPNVYSVSMPIFLPFAGDFVTTAKNGRICYSLHYNGDSYIREINNHLQRINSSFEVDFAFVVTYYRVRDYRSYNRITFQAAVFSNGSDSQVLYNYATSPLSWTVSRRIQTGYSYGRLLDPNMEYNIVTQYTLNSGRHSDLQFGISLGNTGLSGIYYYQLQQFSAPICADQSAALEIFFNETLNDSNLLPVYASYRDKNCSLFGDDQVAAFELLKEMPFASCNYSYISVSTNGRVSFWNPDYTLTDAFPSFSPFAIDLVVPVGKLCVTQHTVGDELFTQINSRLKLLNRNLPVMEPEFAVAVTFSDVREYNRPDTPLTFQLVLFTDGVDTAFFYVYASNMRWQYSRSRLCVGYSYGTLNYQNTSQYETMLCYPPAGNEHSVIVQAGEDIGTMTSGTDYALARRFDHRLCNGPQSWKMSTFAPVLSSDPHLLRISNFSAAICSLHGDDDLKHFDLDQVMPLGGYNYSSIMVFTDGYIDLLSADPADSKDLTSFSVFSLDMVINTGHLCVSQHHENDSFMTEINNRLLAINESAKQLKFAFAVTYTNAIESGVSEIPLSFQLVVFTDGLNTGFFYIYGSELSWTLTSKKLCIGYSYRIRCAGNVARKFVTCYEADLSTTNVIVQVGVNVGMMGYGTDYFEVNYADLLTTEIFANFLPAPQLNQNHLPLNDTCFDAGDDEIHTVVLTSPLPVGQHLHSSAHISINGIVGLSEMPPKYVQSSLDLNTWSTPLIALYHTDLKATDNRTVCYTTHLSDDAYLEEITARLLDLNISNVNISFAMVLTYYRIADYIYKYQRASFQLVLFTDGINTYGLVNYAYSTPWYSTTGVRTGISPGTTFDPRPQYISWYNTSVDFRRLGNTAIPGVLFFKLLGHHTTVAPQTLSSADGTTPVNPSTYQPSAAQTTLSAETASQTNAVRSIISSLAICEMVSDSEICHCRTPYFEIEGYCLGADPEVIMFRQPKTCLPHHASYISEFVQLSVPIHFGGSIYSGFQIASRGYILLHDLWKPATWEAPLWQDVLQNEIKPALIAVYAANLVYNTNKSSSVCYDVFTQQLPDTAEAELTKANALVRAYTNDTNFTAVQVLVVHYRGMTGLTSPRFPSPIQSFSFEAVTAQAVVISSLNRTYVNFNYQFTNYMDSLPLDEGVGDMQPFMAVWFESQPDQPTRTYSAHNASVGEKMREQNRQSSVVSINAFDQVVGNTGILGSWLFQVDTSFVNPVVRKAAVAAPQTEAEALPTDLP